MRVDLVVVLISLRQLRKNLLSGLQPVDIDIIPLELLKNPSNIPLLCGLCTGVIHVSRPMPAANILVSCAMKVEPLWLSHSTR
jgi:hypothetical protein